MRYVFEDFVLDTAVFELRRSGALRPLQPKPLDLLHYLLVHRDRVVLKQELLSHLWPQVRVTENALAQAVACVREALAGTSAPAITGVRGRGYRFALPVTETGDERRRDGARCTGFVVDSRAALDLALVETGLHDTPVVVSGARASAPLGTFRALLSTYAETHRDATIGRVPLAQAIAGAQDEHAFTELVLAFVSSRSASPIVLAIEGIERADLASLLLFAHLASLPRVNVVLAATCALEDLAPSGVASQVLGPLHFAVHGSFPLRRVTGVVSRLIPAAERLSAARG